MYPRRTRRSGCRPRVLACRESGFGIQALALQHSTNDTPSVLFVAVDTNVITLYNGAQFRPVAWPSRLANTQLSEHRGAVQTAFVKVHPANAPSLREGGNPRSRWRAVVRSGRIENVSSCLVSLHQGDSPVQKARLIRKEAPYWKAEQILRRRNISTKNHSNRRDLNVNEVLSTHGCCYSPAFSHRANRWL
jgi:hypothetical protein